MKKLLFLLLFFSFSLSAYSQEAEKSENNIVENSIKTQENSQNSAESGNQKKDNRSLKEILVGDITSDKHISDSHIQNSKVKTPDELLKEGEQSKFKSISFAAKAFNFIKNLPFSLDIGTEGAEHGYINYYSARYKWTERIHTYTKFEMKNTMSSESLEAIIMGNDENLISTSKENTLSFIPFEHYFFFNKALTRQFGYGVGFNLIFENDTNDYTSWIYVDKDSDSLSDAIMDNEGFYYLKSTSNSDFIGVSPLLKLVFRVPIGKFIVFNTETLFSPITFINKKEKSTYRVEGYDKDKKKIHKYSSGNLNDNYWTNTEIKQYIHLDFFNFVAVVANFSYTHRKMDYLFYFSESMPTLGTILDTSVLKVGLCLINVGKTFVRLKTGIFYEHTWTKLVDYIGDDLSIETNTSEGVFKISLGVDF